MAVQQNKKSPSRRNMRRMHDALSNPPLAIEPGSGEVHLRHHISPTEGRQDPGRLSPSSGLVSVSRPTPPCPRAWPQHRNSTSR